MKAWLKRVFIPHEGNNYAPHSLEKAAVVGMFALVIISFAVANVQSIMWITSKWMVSTVLPAVIIDDTNTQRLDGSLGALHENPTLDKAAQMKANDMAKYSYFAHTSPTGVTPWHWFSAAGYNFIHAGENLAVNFTDSDAVVTAWMNSPEHRANIMDGQFTEIGVGTAQGVYEGFPTVFVVQLFGTPAMTMPPSYTLVSTTPAPPPTAPAKPVATVEGTSTVAKAPVAAAGATPATTTPTTTKAVLAQNYTITESSARFPVEPVAEATTATSTPTTTPVEATGTLAANIVPSSTPPQGVLFSGLMTTTTPGVSATIGGSTPPHRYASWWAHLLTGPRLVLEIMYAAIALFVLVALGLSIVIEIRRQQPVQIAYALGLLLVMGGLLYLHGILAFGVSVV